jgi:hypothetical protein
VPVHFFSLKGNFNHDHYCVCQRKLSFLNKVLFRTQTQIHDAEQEKFMVEDMCIIIDENDNPISSASKKECKRNFFVEMK